MTPPAKSPFRSQAWAPWALGLGALALYLATLQPGLGFVDSGVFSASSLVLGVPPTTGYPLYSLLGRLACLSGAEPALALNALSAACAALAVALCYLLCLEIKRNAPAAALAAALLLAFSLTFWSRAVQAKMYSLHWALACALWLCALRMRRDPSARSFRLFCLLLGLSAANHAQTLLLLPGLLILARPKADLMAALFFAAGLSLYLYLPLRSAWDPAVNWGGIHDAAGFWRHVSAWQQRAALSSHKDLSSMAAYGLKLWRNQYGLILGAAVAASACLGWAKLLNRDAALAWALLLSAAIQVFFCLQFNNSEVDAYYVGFYLYLLLLASAGPEGKAAWLGLGLALLGLALNLPRSDRSRDRLARNFALDLAAGIEPGGVLFSSSWDADACLGYLQTAEGFRPDLQLVDTTLIYSTWYLEQLKARRPELVPGPEAAAFQGYVVEALRGRVDPGIEAAHAALLKAMLDRCRELGRPAYALFPDSLKRGRFDGEEAGLLAGGFRPQGLCLRIGNAKAGLPSSMPAWDLDAYLRTPLDEPSYQVGILYSLGLKNLGNAAGRPDWMAQGSAFRAALAGHYEKGIRRW